MLNLARMGKITFAQAPIADTKSRNQNWWIRDDGIVSIIPDKFDMSDLIVKDVLEERGIEIPVGYINSPSFFAMEFLGWIRMFNQENYLLLTCWKDRIARQAFNSFYRFVQHTQYEGYQLNAFYVDDAGVEQATRQTYDVGNVSQLITDIESNIVRQVMPISVAKARRRIGAYIKNNQSPVAEAFLLKANAEQERKHFDTLRDTGHYGKQGAGCIILARDTKRILLPFRSKAVHIGNCWGTWGGALDDGEIPEHAVKRELKEEAGYTGAVKLTPLLKFRSGTFTYHNHLVEVTREFTPLLNWETSKVQWFKYGDWPDPKHPGLAALLADKASVDTIKKAIEGL